MFNGLNDEIETINGYNKLNFNLEPNESIILEPSSLIHMNGRLVLEPTIFSHGGLFSGFKRSLTGQSFIDSQITNKTTDKLKLSLCPTLLGTINKIEILPNQVWRFAPSSFIACTPNLIISGNLNIFSNFKALMGGQNILYTEVTSHDNKAGIIWISSYGAIEKHEIKMGKNSDKLLINDGVFVGMLSEDKNKKINYWDRFVGVSSANGFFKGLLTKTALLMNIYDKKQNAPEDTTCIVYTQSLNIRSLNQYIQSFIQHNSGNTFSGELGSSAGAGLISMFRGGEYYDKYNKYTNKLNN
jgi:uncharacterized protein (AIM24 family)